MINNIHGQKTHAKCVIEILADCKALHRLTLRYS